MHQFVKYRNKSENNTNMYDILYNLYILVTLLDACLGYCCTSYSTHEIDRDQIATVKYSNCKCKEGPSVIFIMLNGDKICVPETTSWLFFVMLELNAEWLTCEDDGYTITNILSKDTLTHYDTKKY